MDKAVQSPSFVHLRVHSEFSVVDGILRISDLIERSVAQGQIFPEPIGELKTIHVGGRTDTTNRLSENHL